MYAFAPAYVLCGWPFLVILSKDDKMLCGISNNDNNIMYNKITEESSQVYSRLFIRFRKNDKT